LNIVFIACSISH